MASSSRKKQDEKNLKTLRELAALPQNKYCFDCNQRGPTYVNTTIGSFVCTKCSGMLRGLTPPHRVKSISMTTFTPEEIDLLKNRGNDYCKSVWLGLCDGIIPNSNTTGGDEQHIRDFMIDKYERKRFYLDPAQALRNGYNKSMMETAAKIKPLNTLVSDPKPIKINGTTEFNRKRPEVNKNNNIMGGFAVNFDNADIFTNNNESKTNGQHPQQESFANFDDVFKNSNNTTATGTDVNDEFSIFDLKFTNSGPMLNQVPLFPKCNTNRWSMPTPTAFDNFNLAQMNSINNKKINTTTTTTTSGVVAGVAAPPPPEDKYAALKDLDNALKTQNAVDWNSSGSNGSLYSSPTPTGSMYSSPSPQSSMFGSPSQAQFMNAFQLHQENNTFSNPFNNSTANGSSAVNGNNGLNWTSNGGSFGGSGQPFANPFRDVNGFASHGFQPIFPANGSSAWGAPNPFKIGATANANSNNPFL